MVPMIDSKKICVYTCIIGGYEILNEQPENVRQSADFLCFTDTDMQGNDTWRPVKIEPAFPEDHTRSQRSIKILQHPALTEYEYSIYIDNSVILSVAASEIIQICLKEQFDLAVCRHSFRERVVDEFQAVSDLAYDDQKDLLRQLEAYATYAPKVLSESPHWCGIIIRRQNVEAVEQLMKVWFQQVLLHSRRDQLSFNFAATKSPARLISLEFNNNQSPIHSWPYAKGRRKTVTLVDMAREIEDAKAVSALVNAIDNSEGRQRRLAPDEESMRLPCSSLHLQAGSNQVGAGGQIAFGVAEFPDFAPMASISGSLVNAAEGETQGSILFQTRAPGSSGQRLIERMRINAGGSVTLSTLPAHDPVAPGTLRFDPDHGLVISLDGKKWLKVVTEELEQ
ncbi:uncharacterized protein DUF616 [Rhizobium sp. PP-F2F-G36]|nr:uncharacterized protein DUF616 [Rhizobium sp. PP-F2F-G36]